MKRLLFLCLLPGIAATACSRPRVNLDTWLSNLRSRVETGTAAAGERLILHRMRNAGAMRELIAALAPENRPSRITYVASGSHLAPLFLCDLLPSGEACEIVMTEVDTAVQQGISEELGVLEKAGSIRMLDEGSRITELSGMREWRLKMKGRSISLKLRLSDPADTSGLFSMESLQGRDLVISHDWAGDPLGNLRVIREFLAAARMLSADPPMLMIADLEAHPYPVDLEFFGVKARSALPYGHRDSDQGAGLHGHIELGAPVFGGAVLLDFQPSWWKEIPREDLDAFFDFLLFNEFDLDRQNVISGGEDPMLAPRILDWFTGFGARDIRGRFLRPEDDFRFRMLKGVTRVGSGMSADLQERLGCRIELFRTLMAMQAEGVDTADLMPSARFKRRPSSGDFPDPKMESLYHQALRRISEFREERGAFGEIGRELIRMMDRDPEMMRWLQLCPLNTENGAEASAVAYRQLRISLHKFENHS